MLKFARYISVVSLVLAAAGCGQKSAERRFSPAVTDAYLTGNAVEGELLVQTDRIATIEKLRANYRVTTIDAIGGVYSLQSPKLYGQEARMIAELEATGEFAAVEPNFIRRASDLTLDASAAMPRDKKWLELWGLKNYGQDSANGTEGVEGADIKALEAWKTTTGSREIVVAVVDTGIDYMHPDLKDNVWRNEAEIGGIDGVDDDHNGYVDDKYGWNFVSNAREKLYFGQLGSPDPLDDQGHGTHVSGTIGAVGNNGVGVTGINWKVRIMAAKFLNAQGSGSSEDEIRAIRYAIENGADVINASYGGGGRSKITENLLAEAGRRGVLFVAAAGNESEDNDATEHYPSGYKLDNIISVAATDNRDMLAAFSNYGYGKVHLAAPGVAITSTFPVLLAKRDAEQPEPYRTWSGTSMATPHVAGAAALVLSARPELRRKPAELKKRLMDSVDWLPQLASRVVSGGRLNVARAVSGEVGTSPVARGNWKEEPFGVATPRNPQERIDQAWKIVKTGAIAIRAHVRRSIVNEPYDLALLYDGLFRPVMKLREFDEDYWTPAVYGDTLYVKFSNAIVNVKRLKEVRDIDDPDTLTSESGSPKICEQDPTTSKWTCRMFEKSGEPFANFDSEGIEIDKISYLPAN